MVLPVITMVAVVYAQYLMVMRSSLLEEMGADYLTTARAKGLREDLVRRRHAVPTPCSRPSPSSSCTSAG